MMKTISILLALLAAALPPAPVQAEGGTVESTLAEAAQVIIGDPGTCVITKSGGVLCWGGWRLTPHDQFTLDTPTPIPGWESGVVSVVSGSNRTCALMSDGSVECFGHGPLGDGTANNSDLPVKVIGIDNATAIYATNHTICVLTAAGGVKCWGTFYDNFLCPLESVPVPKDIVGLTSGVVSMMLYYDRGCAVLVGGGLKCWGLSVYYDYEAETCVPPTNVVGFTNVRTYMPILFR